MHLTLGLALALSAVVTGTTPPAPQVAMPQAQTVREYVQTYFADKPELVQIAECESHFRQYDKTGAVFRGVVNDQDVGVMQINERYHLDASEKLGLDIYTVQGNVAYARYLYDKEGNAPWVSSKPCWGPKVAKLAQNNVLAVAK